MSHYTATVREDLLLELPLDVRQRLSPGQVLDVEFQVDEMPATLLAPNQPALDVLTKIAHIQRNMRETDGSQTDRMIREARSGAMYGE